MRLRRILAILGAAIRAPVRARVAAAARRQGRQELDRALESLGEQDKRLLFAFGEDEPLRDELERDGRFEQFTRAPNITLELLSGRDHQFRPIRAQREVHAALERALERELNRLGRGTEAASVELGAE